MDLGPGPGKKGLHPAAADFSEGCEEADSECYENCLLDPTASPGMKCD